MSIRGNITGIGYLRGAAAVMVAAVHASNLIGHVEYFGETPFNKTEVGNYRVAILFLVSGFVNTIASAGLNGKQRATQADFLTRRFISRFWRAGGAICFWWLGASRRSLYPFFWISARVPFPG